MKKVLEYLGTAVIKLFFSMTLGKRNVPQLHYLVHCRNGSINLNQLSLKALLSSN